MRRLKIVDNRLLDQKYDVPPSWEIKVEDGQEINEGDPIAVRGENVVGAKHKGRIVRDDRHIRLVYEERDEREYEVPAVSRLLVEEGTRVKAGQQLTEGVKNPHRILRILGREETYRYLLGEFQLVYRSQGVTINDKHFEVIIRKMLNRVQIVSPGDTELLPGELYDRMELQEINEKTLAAGGKRGAHGVPVLLGVTKSALNTDSFLSASSFQHTIKVLAGAAIEGKEDRLYGLKENVIIGKLIPAGTGFPGYRWDKHSMAQSSNEGELHGYDPDDVTEDMLLPPGMDMGMAAM
jgi:DNA-directed RNA polymerase subunit beta'